MATFQHGKNAFLAIGYDTASTPTTVGSSATTSSLPLTGVTTMLSSGIATLQGGSVYGLFVNGVPCGSASAPSSTTTLATGLVLPSAPASGSIALPMVNISQFTNDIGFPTAIDANETTTFSQAGVKTYIVGLKGYTVTFSGMFDLTASTSGYAGGIDQIVNDAINFQNAGNTLPFVYGPANPGAFTGVTASPKFYGQAYLTKYDLKSSVSGVVTFDGEMQVTGVVSRTTL
jgi:hypothetical protein